MPAPSSIRPRRRCATSCATCRGTTGSTARCVCSLKVTTEEVVELEQGTWYISTPATTEARCPSPAPPPSASPTDPPPAPRASARTPLSQRGGGAHVTPARRAAGEACRRTASC
ncbi:DUF5707 domain-containing protein [Streptomyces atroolivaceus]|uniref:DUF5707 domain-containing protein n=1 Tax=Streptomyces atroolivaceus TaxID=66869 RepID=UPI0033C95925